MNIKLVIKNEISIFNSRGSYEIKKKNYLFSFTKKKCHFEHKVKKKKRIISLKVKMKQKLK